MSLGYASERASRRRVFAALAAVWLAFGWAHVWLHNAAFQPQGHFSSTSNSDCPLHAVPAQLVPEPPSCAAPDGFEFAAIPVPEVVFAPVATRLPGVRAPPLS
ncbi:MAG TPA: hypothetical protein VGD06_02620 [Acidobacteriota bacterium]